tara:strand:+ start:6187 stop:6327 length:141 start_codon:yes stop_codon:yes gene_type:complete
MKPITHELAYVYITLDGKVYFDEKKAEIHQRKITKKKEKELTTKKQ